MSVIDASDTLSLQDYFSTTLSGTISSTDTILTLASVPSASEGFLVLELGTASQEIIYYNSKTSNTVTCPSVARGRGQGGTTAVAHTTGASVKQVVNADFFKEIQNGNANTGLHTWFNESFYPYVQTGCVWTADSAGASLNGSMTSGIIYINGKRLTLATVTAHGFTASKDTYIDVTFTTGNNNGTVVYTEVANNAASPALAANSIRIGIVVTGATIAAAASVNQGQQDRVLPIASSVAYSVTDSLGNLICPRDPTSKLIGYRQVIVNQSINTGTYTDITGLSCPVIVPAGRKVNVTACMPATLNGTAGSGVKMNIVDVTASTTVTETYGVSGAAAALMELMPNQVTTPAAAGARTYKAQMAGYGAATSIQSNNPATYPVWIKVELN